MSISYKIIRILFIVLLTITSIELIYYIYSFSILQPRSETASLPTPFTPIPSLDLPSGNDQSFRLPDAQDRLTRFLTQALFGLIGELTNNSVTQSVNFKIDSLYVGKVEAVYQGKEAQKLFPADPKYPKRTVVLIIDLTDNNQSKPFRVSIVESELPYLTITDEHDKKLNIDDMKGKQVKFNRIIEFPLTKKSDIVTYDPLVYNKIIVLDQK